MYQQQRPPQQLQPHQQQFPPPMQPQPQPYGYGQAPPRLPLGDPNQGQAWGPY
jgi:hypothetical protein